MNDIHQLKVNRIAKEVQSFYKTKKKFRIYHGSTNSTRVLNFKKDEYIDISDLNKVLAINTQERTAYIEPNVAMDKLVKATLKKKLLPPVVMEFPGITVGGAIQGNGGESSSFKWGAFNQTIKSHEIIIGNGEIRNTSPKQDADLFYGVPGTAGTIGVLTAATIQLIPAKKYVKLEYRVVRSFEEARSVINATTKDTTSDFVDGIMFSKEIGVVVKGVLSDKIIGEKVRFSRAHDQWYYLHVEQKLAQYKNGWTETAPIKDYLFRYDRGAFWVGRFAFEMFGVPYTRFMRWVLNPILHTRKLYEALQESGQSQHHIVQDLVLPAENFIQFSKYIDKELSIYPLWLCPMQVDRKATFQLNNLEVDSIINVGVWGSEIPDYDKFIQANRSIEKKVLELEGKKWSYAHSYFTEEEFWSMYNKDKYDKLRKKYHAINLPTLFDKLTVTKRLPVQKKKALFKTIFGMASMKSK